MGTVWCVGEYDLYTYADSEQFPRVEMISVHLGRTGDFGKGSSENSIARFFFVDSSGPRG